MTPEQMMMVIEKQALALATLEATAKLPDAIRGYAREALDDTADVSPEFAAMVHAARKAVR